MISEEGSGRRKAAQTETIIATAIMRQVPHAEKRLTGMTPLPKA